ncbi:Phage Tail Collar domain protein [Azospirillum lipoferum 4B]|uniref:Phage Tail Collar domain protein n=2 Tax=Azospirillum lipoferum TaxID=193 RepID=G7Z674_AZOL4|nr:Phage Tail Collar domain protein [Azospirillum lipoferum 4B]
MMEYLISDIILLACSYVPESFLPCDGSIVPIAQYQALYSLIGTQYGGDGRTTFGLPNLKGKEPLPTLHYVICYNGYYPPRPA